MTYSNKEAQDEWSRFLKDYTNIRKTKNGKEYGNGTWTRKE